MLLVRGALGLFEWFQTYEKDGFFKDLACVVNKNVYGNFRVMKSKVNFI